jgi:hypothetical protein
MVMRAGLPWRCVLCAAFLAAVAGCAGRPGVPVSDPSAEVSDPSVEVSDSTRNLEEALIDDGRLDGVGAIDPADASNDAEAAEGSPRVSRRAGSLDLEVVTGFRSDSRIRWVTRSGLSAGVRWRDRAASGFAGFEGRGWLRAFYAGRITLRGAERLVLGRGMGSYAFSGSGPVRGGFAASPSFSRWYGYPGVAAAFGWNGWRADAAALGRCGDENAFSPATVWTSVSRELESGMVGITVGIPAGIETAGKPSTAGEIGGADGPCVVSLFASARAGRVAASAEAVRTCERIFFAVRIASCERGAGPRWSALFFDAPHGSPLGASGLERMGRTDRGARFDVATSVGAARCEGWVAAGRTRSDSRQTAYRRVSLALSKKGPAPVWWQGSVLYKCGYEEDYPSSPVDVGITGERECDLRLRAAVGVRSGGSVSSSVRADVLPEYGGRESGVVLVLSTEAASGRLEALFQAAAHSIPRGRSATLWRPGAGPFECLAPLYGKGSDVAVRASYRVTVAARLYLFYVSAWSGAARAYAGFEYRR